MARTPIIAGNWKMNKGTAQEARELIDALLPLVADLRGVDIVVCPPYTALSAAQEALGDSAVALGAQDVFWKDSGAYTGQISAKMLKDLGVEYVIVGHSESRGRFGVPEPDFTPEVLQHFGETDVTVNRKVKAALADGLCPIVCIGETLKERDAGETDGVVRNQVRGALADVGSEQIAASVCAYEPVWAIGTGKTCSADEANRVCGVIRSTIAELYGSSVSEKVRIQYGGSMKADNAPELLSKPHIDGGLIGGASLKAADFAAVLRVAAQS